MAAVTSEHIISIEELRSDVSHLVTEDDTPVDNLFSEKQQRLTHRTAVHKLAAAHKGQA